MTSDTTSSQQNYRHIFQQRIERMLRHWAGHSAIKTLDVGILDQERENVIQAIALGLELDSAWEIVRDLVLDFTPFMERRGHWEVWNGILNRAIVAAQQVGDIDSEITLSALLARLFQRQSRPQETIRHYRRVIRLARQHVNHFEEGRACSNLGYLYIDDLGKWWRAEILCCHALTIFEALDSDHGRAHTENHLGFLYARQRLWDKAEHHLKQACTLWKTMGDEHSLIRGFLNLGMLYYEMSQSIKALEFLEKALVQIQLTGEEAELGIVWMNLGLVYWQMGDLEKAEHDARQAEAVFRHYSNPLGLAQVWDNLGLVYLGQRKWDKARQFFKESLGMYQSLNNWDGEIKVLLGMIECELVQENQKLAEQYLNDLKHLIQQHYSSTPNHLAERIKKFGQRLNRLRIQK